MDTDKGRASTRTRTKLKQLGELAARKYAEDNDLKFVSPYNDYEVIAGQVKPEGHQLTDKFKNSSIEQMYLYGNLLRIWLI